MTRQIIYAVIGNEIAHNYYLVKPIPTDWQNKNDMMPKRKQPIAVIVLFALVASTAVRIWRSTQWEDMVFLADGNAEQITTEYYSSSSRRLDVQPPAEGDYSFYARNYRQLISKGYDPNDKRFEHVLHKRMERKAVISSNHQAHDLLKDKELVIPLTEVPTDNSIYARTFRGLAARGYNPNTQQFQQLLKQRLLERTKQKQVVVAQTREKRQKQKGAREHPTVVRRKLKETENIWLRGNFIKAHSIQGLVWHSNEWKRGEEVKNAAVADEARKVSL